MTENASLHITFWGVRGSHPVPGAETVGFGGNTACVEVRAHGHTLILDAGTGIIGLGRALSARARQTGRAVEATILFTHFHHDHIQGFPFFGPAYAPSARLHLFGPETFEQSLESVLVHNQMPSVFPVTLQDMGAAKTIHTLQEGDMIVLGESAGGVALRRAPGLAAGPWPPDVVVVRAHHSYAHPGGVLLYRIEFGGHALVYATDTEGYVGTDRRLVAFAQGADVLIHDAQYTEDHYGGLRAGLPATQGYGHSTARMACEVAEAAQVRQLVLFHYDPGYDDATIGGLEADAQALFPNAIAAREGLTIALGEPEPAAHAGRRQTATA